MPYDAISGAARADFATTEMMFRADAGDDALDTGFAPTQFLMPSSTGTATATARDPAFAGVVLMRPAPRAPWLGRFEATLDRVLPGGCASLLGLFLCVSMSIVLISAMLPLVDRA